MSELSEKELQEFAEAFKNVAIELEKNDKLKTKYGRVVKQAISEALTNVADKIIREIKINSNRVEEAISEAFKNVLLKSDGKRRKRKSKRRSKKRSRRRYV